MKLTIEQRDLSATLKRLASIVPSRGTIPVLANVAIRATDAALTMSATDLDIEASSTVSAHIMRAGACTVSAKTLADIAAKLPAGALVTIDHDANTSTLTVSAGRSRFNLATLPIEDFPVLASETFAATFTIPADDLARLFSTVFAASTEETRYYLQGVYLHNVDGNTTAVTTDGHRFAMARVGIGAEFPAVIVPTKTVNEAVKSFPSGDIAVSVSATKIRFAAPHFTLLSKVIDGTFPDYTRIIPTHKDSVSFDADVMRAAVDRVVTVSEEKSRAIKLDIAADEITITTQTAMQAATDAIACETNGSPLEIGFSGAYVNDVLRQMQGRVTMQYGGAMTPVIFRQNEGALYIVMPMRVK